MCDADVSQDLVSHLAGLGSAVVAKNRGTVQ